MAKENDNQHVELEEAELPAMSDFFEDNLISTAEEITKKREEKQASSEKTDDDENLDDPEKIKDPQKQKTEKTKPAPDEEEEEEEDELAKKPEAKKPREKQKPAKEQEEEEEEDDGFDPEDNFWTDVANISGISLDIDWEKAGIEDPESPEGAAYRDKLLVQTAIEEYAEALQEKYPKVYKLLQHEMNGGNIEDLYKPGYKDYSKVVIKEDDVDQQKSILLEDYKSKNIPEKRAIRLIEDAEDEGTLLDDAKKVIEAKKQKQAEEEERILAEQKQREDQLKENDQKIIYAFTNLTSKGEVGRFKIPQNEIEGFQKHIFQKVQRLPGGGYAVVNPITNQSINALVEQMYFDFKKGDLKNLVEKEARTESVRRLRRKFQKKEKETSMSGRGAAPKAKPGVSQKDDVDLPDFQDFYES